MEAWWCGLEVGDRVCWCGSEEVHASTLTASPHGASLDEWTG